MAKFQVIEFWVKPQGALAKKRYARVFADYNGNITVENIPGEQIINQPSIDDYKSTNFPYAEGQLVTQFCNTETFTKYRLLASRTNPWLTVQTDLNQPECGYQTPLPTPAVPQNPFGTAPYDLYLFHNFCDVEGQEFTVNVYRKNYNNQSVIVPVELPVSDKSPIKLSYTSGDDKFSPIRPCVCDFSFMALENFDFKALYNSDEREFKLEVIKVSDGSKLFSGFITPDNANEPFIAPPYPVTIRATDGLGALKKITYPLPVGSSTNIKQKFLHILAFALAKTNLNLDIMTGANLYALGMQTGLSDDPLEQGEVSPLRMSDTSGNVFSCYDAIEAVCKEFGASISQVGGVWRVFRVNEIARGAIRYRLYDYTARFKLAGSLGTVRLAGDKSQDVILNDKNHDLTTRSPYKLVKVLQEFGRAPDVIYNGNFEDWDGQNFRYWTRYGAISISRVQKFIKASAGDKIAIDDYACQFNEKANSGKWIEDVPVWMNKGQTAKLSMNIGTTDGVYDFKIRFKIGQYYLTNANGAFEWVPSLSTTAIRIDNRLADIFSFSINIEIPAIPESGDMTVQIYGFVKMEIVRGGGSGRPTRGGWQEVDAYTPIAIDNVAISSTVSDDKKVKSLINVSSQNGVYSETPDPVTIIWGEYRDGAVSPIAVSGSYTIARPSKQSDSVANSETAQQSQLQSIYLPNGDYAKGWFEFGESSTPIPIGLALARAILKAYQTSYSFLSGSFMGDNLSYIDSFNIVVPNEPDFSSKIFIWQNASFDIKYRTANGDIVEIFSKGIISNDYTTPQNPGSTSNIDQMPPIIQNPNLPTNLIGIFTEQFTPEFT